MTVEEFKNETKEGINLDDFWAPWCGPCKMLGPILEKIDESNPDVNVVKVQVDDSREIAAQYGVRSIPTMVLMKGSEIIDTKVGALSREKIQEWLDKNSKA